ncbi:UPF0175 family protein [Halarsenatibacter silvermanii]|uniref:Uncharacterized protein family (UPF0175) n=1 Tax=Halarsenatibacter silvermanii TaxID=321763 RepID=A0A1G9M3W2_9FIRM|nr:UPF0175 family protein [Halarsenatibacter silvermanii]SDL68641.1 Uncharacterised protein family (UPF0175) [Halarsenatibacter silvermanii]
MPAKKEVEFPEEILVSLKTSEDELIKEMKLALAVKYFKEKKLSVGQAAELAEMPEEDFIRYLGEEEISVFRYDDLEELEEDIENA